MENVWKIRLLGGVLHGREVWMPEGRLSLGERGCDLCIPLNCEGQVVLQVVDDQLFIESENRLVRVNGRKHAQGKPLPAEGVLETAGIAMAFGLQDSQLAGFQLPGRTSVIFRGGALVLIMLLGLSSTVLWNLEPITPAPTMAKRVDTLFQQMTLSDVTVQWARDGTLQLTGYCQQESTLRSFREKIKALGVMYSDNVICTDQLVQNVQDVLMQAGYSDAKVVSISPGSVEISADITMGQRWAEVQPLLAEVPGLSHWQIENPFEEQGKTIITTLVESGLGGAVSMTAVGHSFVISGLLNTAEKGRLTTLMSEIREQHPSVHLSYQDVPASADFGNQLPSPIAGIVHGKRGDYLVLKDGERLTIGSRLPDGSELVVLNDEAAAFRKGRALFNFPFNF